MGCKCIYEAHATRIKAGVTKTNEPFTNSALFQVNINGYQNKKVTIRHCVIRGGKHETGVAM